MIVGIYHMTMFNIYIGQFDFWLSCFPHSPSIYWISLYKVRSLILYFLIWLNKLSNRSIHSVTLQSLYVSLSEAEHSFLPFSMALNLANVLNLANAANEGMDVSSVHYFCSSGSQIIFWFLDWFWWQLCKNLFDWLVGSNKSADYFTKDA